MAARKARQPQLREVEPVFLPEWRLPPWWGNWIPTFVFPVPALRARVQTEVASYRLQDQL
jgi:hypothetical protein